MTLFEEVYDVFLSHISDHIFMNNDEDDEMKFRYLRNSVVRFSKCKKDLSKRTNDSFLDTLTDEEIQILGVCMVIEYLNPQIISLNNIKQALGSKDFSISSQANFLDALISLRENKKIEFNKLMLDYTYNNGNIGKLK